MKKINTVFDRNFTHAIQRQANLENIGQDFLKAINYYRTHRTGVNAFDKLINTFHQSQDILSHGCLQKDAITHPYQLFSFNDNKYLMQYHSFSSPVSIRCPRYPQQHICPHIDVSQLFVLDPIVVAGTNYYAPLSIHENNRLGFIITSVVTLSNFANWRHRPFMVSFIDLEDVIQGTVNSFDIFGLDTCNQIYDNLPHEVRKFIPHTSPTIRKQNALSP